MKKLYFICCFLLISSGFLVQSGEIFTEEFTTIQNQLFADIFEIKGGFDRLEVLIDVLNKRQSHQLTDLRTIISSHADGKGDSKNSQYNEDICEEVLYFSNETVTKYDEFNAKLNLKLQELQKNQIQNLENILNNKNFEKNCQNLKPKQTTIDNVLTNIVDKLSKLEQQLTQFETLQEKLATQQKKFDKINDDQLRILQKIKEKLIEHDNKFVNYARGVPDMNSFSNKINNITTWSPWHHRHHHG